KPLDARFQRPVSGGLSGFRRGRLTQRRGLLPVGGPRLPAFRTDRRRLFHGPGIAPGAASARFKAAWYCRSMISGKARCAGVVGWPVAHSLSPRLHNHWLKAHGIDGAYIPLPIPREALAEVLKGLRQAGFKGVNLTIPHKEAAFSLAHRLDDAARAAGAVNL